MRVLVTGGAGYVGSHCARRLADEGFDVVTFDNLSTGWREAASGRLFVGDLRDPAALAEVFADRFDCVLHFAAVAEVATSVRDPLGYFHINVGGTLNLLQAMRAGGCDKLVFSSTCAVYGVPERQPMDESLPHRPISPYGESKAVVEQILGHGRQVGDVASVSLRYFNAAGASADGWIGEVHVPETHLIPNALEAVRTGAEMSLFGHDHPTRDGTCVRDYIHVLDLAEAHLAAVRRLVGGGEGGAWNLGTGTGSSVREVLDRVEAVTGREVPHRLEGRRPGDPPMLVADASKAAADLGWTPQRTLHDVVEHAWAWHERPRFGPRAF